MKNITMTIDATHTSRVRPVRPGASRVLLTGNRGWVNGTTVPTAVAHFPMTPDAQAPTSFVGGFGVISTDLAFRSLGDPPV